MTQALTDRVRSPAVAGVFYPEDPALLRRTVEQYLTDASGSAAAPGRADERNAALPIKILVVPHAGYAYSGPVAASAYRRLAKRDAPIHRVVLVGPSHRVPFSGIAFPSADAFRTPLGDIPIDRSALAAWADLPFVTVRDDAHQREHSLEVQLPFLQHVAPNAMIIPLVVGDAQPRDLQLAIERVWDGPETVVIVSSDLSHYLPYDEAKAVDAATTRRIANLDSGQVSPAQACGAIGVEAALRLARGHGLSPQVLDVRNSGDTAGDRSRVVGYGAYAFA